MSKWLCHLIRALHSLSPFRFQYKREFLEVGVRNKYVCYGHRSPLCDDVIDVSVGLGQTLAVPCGHEVFWGRMSGMHPQECQRGSQRGEGNTALLPAGSGCFALGTVPDVKFHGKQFP